MNLQLALFLITIVSAWIKYLVIPSLKEKRAWFWVQRAVLAAEQVIIGTGMGDIRREEVIAFLMNNTKLSYSEAEWDILIEAAVAELNLKKGEL